MSDAWDVEQLGAGRFRFTNVSGGRLAMITLTPHDATEVAVEDGAPGDAWVVPSPVGPGEAFTAVVRGAGVRITATAVPSMQPVYQDLPVS